MIDINTKGFTCDECPLIDKHELNMRLSIADYPEEFQYYYLGCDKIGCKFAWGGYCEDAWDHGDVDKKINTSRKTGIQYRRKMRKKVLGRKKKILSYGYKYSNGYLYKGNYIKYPKNSNLQHYLKRYSNKIIRREDVVNYKGNSYRKYFDYAWTVN